ncbi:MAG: hypothetical protein RLZZ196_2182 [Bacteroidota bacterium]|jgi:hypothetical protein
MILSNDNYIVVDNFLEKPEYLISLSKQLKYHASNIKGIIPGIKLQGYMSDQNWIGFRSDPLVEIDKDLVNSILQKIFFGLYGSNVECTYNVEMYLQFMPQIIKNVDSLWHKDIGSIYAGIIYLNKDSNITNSGTILNIDNENIVIENKFNRMLMYRADIKHRPENVFGTTIDNSRLSIVFFINELTVKFLQ